MVLRGHVRNGRVEIDNGVALPEGAAVEVFVNEVASGRAHDEALPTVYEQLADIVGTVPGLPEDLSLNHDHYLYGTPRRK